QGIVALIGLPDGQLEFALDLCRGTECIVFLQVDDPEEALTIRKAAAAERLLGTRLFVEHAAFSEILLADNIADRVLVADQAAALQENELLRVLRPRGIAIRGNQRTTKPVPEGTDAWSHPYHGPDNNPQSEDQLVRGSFRTQFIGYPKFSPMPEQTVVAGGRIYKAMGHIAHKANQNEMLNTLLCINAYNGSILWRRSLTEGFMLHRNTMIATEDTLYMGDDKSLKIIDGESGELVDEIKITKEDHISDGPVWKWMALRQGVLYAMVGNTESLIETQKSMRRGLGHWPWDMWDGHEYEDPRTSFGFGRTLIAIDLNTRQRLWHYRDEDFLDARAMCMNDSQIYCYAPGKFIASIDLYTGKLKWKNSDPELLDAIGDNE
ncbi:MAG: class I SAM-dependent methyltransferase, partial [bacterium]|nr:class I SAM-dependent methyltransferase [bacterium]